MIDDKVLSMVITSGVISDEVEEIFRDGKNLEMYIVGGYIHEDKATFLCGNMEHVTVPLSFFDTCTNFDHLEIIDCGQTVKFGDYEAATDAILSFKEQ